MSSTDNDRIKTVSLRPSEFYGDYVLRTPTSRHRASRRRDRDHNAEWSGTDSYEEATQLALKGWPEGAERARKLATRLSEEMVTSLKRPEIAFDVTGDMFDMGRVMADEPESWMKWEDGQEDGGKPLHIVLNCSVSAGVDKKIIEMRGTAVCALVIVLEAAARPCKVEIGAGIQDYGYGEDDYFLEPRVVVKDYYEPIQVDAVAYALIHTSFFRRHIFSAMEVMGVKSSGYGMPSDLRGPKGDLYLGHALWGDKQWGSEQAAQKWIMDQLKLQGVQFK